MSIVPAGLPESPCDPGSGHPWRSLSGGLLPLPSSERAVRCRITGAWLVLKTAVEDRVEGKEAMKERFII